MTTINETTLLNDSDQSPDDYDDDTTIIRSPTLTSPDSPSKKHKSIKLTFERAELFHHLEENALRNVVKFLSAKTFLSLL